MGNLICYAEAHVVGQRSVNWGLNRIEKQTLIITVRVSDLSLAEKKKIPGSLI